MANLDIPKKSNWNQRTYFLDFILIGDPSDLQNSAMYRRTIPEDSSIDDYIEINLSKNFGTADYIKIPTFDLSHCGCGSWTSWSMLPSSFMNNQIWALKAARDTDFTNPELNTLVDAPWDYENFARQMASDFKKKLEETKKSIQDTIIQVPTNKQPAEQNPTPMGAIDKIPNERKPNQRYFNHQQSDSQDRPRMPYRGNGYTDGFKDGIALTQKDESTTKKKNRRTTRSDSDSDSETNLEKRFKKLTDKLMSTINDKINPNPVSNIIPNLQPSPMFQGNNPWLANGLFNFPR